MMCLQPLGKSLDTIEEGKKVSQSDLMQELCDCN